MKEVVSSECFSEPNPLLVGIDEIRERSLQIKKEQDFLLDKNKSAYEDIIDLSGEELSRLVRSDIEKDRTCANDPGLYDDE